MKKLKNEKALLKKALEVGQDYAIKRGYKPFNPTDSADQKVECIYRLLINDKLLAPLPEDQENGLHMRQRLAKWIAAKLPEDHPLLQ
ncbi:DUF5062 family protein [Ferrimonas gelatinilytica]|uniref:DUF5062 family protein n=1 Tax=Ferrimonas gelatinilytica TaxID=1255257 RepID=A0ABP9SEN8_9GAMM